MHLLATVGGALGLDLVDVVGHALEHAEGDDRVDALQGDLDVPPVGGLLLVAHVDDVVQGDVPAQVHGVAGLQFFQPLRRQHPGAHAVDHYGHVPALHVVLCHVIAPLQSLAGDRRSGAISSPDPGGQGVHESHGFHLDLPLPGQLGGEGVDLGDHR